MKSSKNRRVVLGLNAYSHDAGVALFVDRRLVFAAEEERWDRVKHSAAFPRRSIEAALAHANLSPGDIDAVAFPWQRGMARLRKAAHVVRRLPASLAFLREHPDGLPRRIDYLRQIGGLARDLRDCGVRAPIRRVEHHRAHAWQAWRFGPVDDAAILTADGMGEWTATATWEAANGRLRLRRCRSYPHSLGKVYSAVTQHLGFRPDSGEGKTMGLAPYGRPLLVEAFRELVRPDPRRLYRVRLDGFAYPDGHTRMGGAPFERRFGEPRVPESEIDSHHEDLAFAAQQVLEEVVLDVARRLREETGRRHLGLAGGLFLNCSLNGRLAREAGFDSLFVFPAAGDAGAAAGAAACVAGMERTELDDAFLGDSFDAEAIDRALGERAFRVVADPAAWAARALQRGKVVGWFSGRMEFGPRALGARSILADPRDPAVRDRLNAEVKFRESFRPFAPAVLEERAADWFEEAAPSPFMLRTFQVRPARRREIGGVVHVDGSARVQTVGRGDALAPFRRLLDAFAARTGVPVLLNTSFNVRGEPIVRTPEEAIACFERTGMDALVLGDRILENRYPAQRR